MRITRGATGEALGTANVAVARKLPAAELREFVEYYWLVRWNLRGQEPQAQHALPTIAVYASFFAGNTGVVGPSHGTLSHLLTGSGQGLAVRFRPGTFRAYLPGPVSELADHAIPLSAVFGDEAEGTAAEVQRAGTDEEMVTAVDRLLRRSVPPLTRQARRAVRIVETIAGTPSITRVDQLSAATRVTVRTLQRLFSEHVGTSPKWAIRAYRLTDAARRAAMDENRDFGLLAAELGYTDQAHFVGDFGFSPPAPGTR
ncbi:helix-turn-helix domain-containing protein [Amycolatopsis minnesotensis]|uniref:Helix-turn-helix domain-containing protein n=1 Tax=Amycolatopsis minnesotensis TaxID=337894 RepID=A0ABP5BE03_9PSEU